MLKHLFQGVVKSTKSRVLSALSILSVLSICGIACSSPAFSVAKASTLTLGVSTNVLNLTISPSANGNFAKSNNATISVWTDNFTGYSLYITSDSSTSLVNSNDDEIESISSEITEQAFSTSSSYNNKWGYLPSQYVTTSQGVNTTVPNTNFLPAPATTGGDFLAVTSAANTLDANDDPVDDTYTLAFGARVDYDLPAGTYSYTYVLSAVANSIVYSINYNENISTGTVSNMPSPNPQALTIDGGTAAALSYGTLSSSEPTHTSMFFGGWCDVATTVDSTTGDYICSGTIYQPGDDYPIDQTADGTNITLYAIWSTDPFPIVWSQMGACEFHGATNGNITGSQCTDYHTKTFIDTGVPLYNNTNYLKDYEIHITIDHYDPTEQVNHTDDNSQQTFFGDKLGSSAADGLAPGPIVRRSGNNIQLSSKLNSTQVTYTTSGTRPTEISMYRINNVVYYSLNSGPLIKLQDITGFSQQYELTTWFGGYPSDACTGSPNPCVNAKRIPEATFSNMYIKLGDFDESDYYQVLFDHNYGSNPTVDTYLVHDGDSIATLPRATRTGYTFGGWWTAASGGTRINAPYTPTADARLYAHWTQNYTITFDPQNNNSTSTATVTAGSQLGSNYPSPDPTYTDHIFQGWFTQSSGGTQISSSTVPSGNTTYYAQWKGTVDLATVASNSISMTTNDTETVTVSNAADLEGFTFSSSDTTVATIDASTGVITPLSAGTTNISITGASSNITNQIVTVTVTQPVVQYTITFDPQNNNATSPWDETINAGDDLTSVYPASNPTYTDHIFQGWFTQSSGGTQISSSTTPSGTTTYYAQWKGTVDLATVSNNAISVATDGSATITVTNAANLEGFTFSSSDTTVATIDASTGVITPLTAGTTIISITGASSTLSNQIVTVTVTQAVSQYTITFNPHNETSSWNETINAGDDLTAVYPATDPTYTNHLFQGWYTAASGGTQISSSTEPSGSTTYHAQWLGTVALATFASNNLSVDENDTVTISVTNSAEIENYGFASLDSTVATVDPTTGVVTGVSAGTTSIRMTGASSLTFVDIPVTVTTPTYTIYFNPHNNTANSSATVVAGQQIGSNNIPADPTNSDPEMIFMGWFTAASGGTEIDENTVPSADGETYHAQYKKIVCKVETSSASLHTVSGHTYGYIADNTTPEAGDAYNCDIDYDGTYNSANERFYYLTTDENGNSSLVAWNSYYDDAWAAGTSNDSIFAYTAALAELPDNTTGAWENPGLIEQETGKAARFSTRNEVATACGKTLSQMNETDALLDCDYFMEHSGYDGGGRSALWLMKENTTQYRIHTGSSNRHIATNSSGNSMVRPTIVVPYKLIEKYTPQALDVTNAVIGNSDLTVMVGQTLTIQVTNSASLEPYTFSSDDTSIATVNSSTGVVTGVDEGTVDIIMTGTTSGLTKTIAVEVVANPDIPVVFDVSNDATRGFLALSTQWAQSPVNLTIFNKDTTTINNSTWGDISELSELQYWQAVRSNFVNNQCFIQNSTAYNTKSDAVKPLSSLSNWTSGSVDCSKPTPYDTETNAALTVRLNDAQGAVVAYADAGSGVIHNMIPGQTYYWEETNDSSVYGYVTAVSNGSSTGTRWVDMDVVRNVRDLGGLPVTYTNGSNQTVTGTLAYGRLFRGEKMQSVNASVLTNLGITTEYNVGDEYSDDTHLSDYHLNNVIHYDFDYHSGDENNASSNYMKAWTAVTNIMTDIVDTNTTKNIYFHCRVGADRTGTVAYLLEGLLGVPDEQRYEEYGLTNVSGLYDRTRYYKQKASNNALKFVYMMGYVQTTQDIINWYMHGPNASMTLVQNFRTAMTVPTQP